MKSARLSSSAPNCEVAFSSRARRPSSPSKMPAAMMANTAYWKSPLNAKRIAVIPAHSANKVRTLGTMRLNDESDNRPRMRDRRARPRTRSLGDRIAKGSLLIAKLCRPVYTNWGAAGRRSPGRCQRSMRDAALTLVPDQPVGEHGLATNHALAERDERQVGRRDIDVDARAKANEADALPGGEQLPLIDRADDAPRHQSGDQHYSDLGCLARSHAECQTLVVEARLVEAGVDEAPLGVAPRRDLAADRCARNVDIEQVEENADPRDRGHPHRELGRRRRRRQRDDDPIGRADDQPRTDRRHPPGIAKEIRDPQRDDQPRPAARPPHQEKNDCRQRRTGDELPAVGVNRSEDLAEHGGEI